MVCKFYLGTFILYSSNVVLLATLTVALNVSTFERENDISITHAEWWRHKKNSSIIQHEEGEEEKRKNSSPSYLQPRHIPLSPKSQFWIDKIARKLAPLFSMISLWNDRCWTMGYDQGTCYSKAQCLAKGGTPHGYCAGGFGVCCVFSYTCDTTTALNATYFTNHEFPYSSEGLTTCKHSVRKFDGVCQLRLDFDVFELDRPTDEGECWTDLFFIHGADIQLPPLCGDLTGHHIYLPIGYNPEIEFHFELNSQSPYRRWKILMTKIRCCSANMAPGGCLQHLRGISGRLTSFNYIHGQDSNLNNLNYGVCVRREKGFCAIQWNVCHHYRKKREATAQEYDAENGILIPITRIIEGNNKKNGSSLSLSLAKKDVSRATAAALEISRGYSGINFSGGKGTARMEARSRPNYFGNNQNVRCGDLAREAANNGGPYYYPYSTRRPRNVTLLQLISCPSDWGYYKLDDSWRPVPIDSSKVLSTGSSLYYHQNLDHQEQQEEEQQQEKILKKKDHTKITTTASSIKHEPILHYGTKGHKDKEQENESPDSHHHFKPWKANSYTTTLKPLPLPEYKPFSKLVKPSKLTTTHHHQHHVKPPQRRPIWSGKPSSSSHIILAKPKPPKGVFVKPPKIKVKPKPRPKPKPWKGFGIHKHKHKVRPRPRPKPRPKPKPKPGKRKKPKRPKNPSNSTCKKKIIPIPFPVPILPVAVIPFPIGGGGGGGGGGGHGHDHDGGEGWGSDEPVISTVEPYLVRVATDSDRENGLSSFCMEWEQIPCEMWNQHPDHQLTTFYYDHDEM